MATGAATAPRALRRAIERDHRMLPSDPSRSAIGLFLLLLLTTPVAAEEPPPIVGGTERLASDRPEAWAMQRLGSLTLLTAFGPPTRVEPGSVRLGVELGWIPHLSEDKRRVGFDGQKVEDMNQAPLLARPRVEIGLPWKLSLEAAYMPSVEVFDVRPNHLALALGRPLLEGGGASLGLRLLGQWGRIRATVTCPSELVAFGDDPANNPFGCEEESRDETTVRSLGLELTGSLRPDRGRGIVPHLSVGVHRFDNEFQVDTLRFGFRDRQRLTSRATTLSVTGGVDIPAGERSAVALALFYSPLEVDRRDRPRRTETLLNVRLQASYRLR